MAFLSSSQKPTFYLNFPDLKLENLGSLFGTHLKFEGTTDLGVGIEV